MPIYDYRCTECGTLVEVIHAIDGAGPAACDVCGGPMRKALSPPAIHFKGSGWAKKDARTAAKSKATPDKSDGAGPDGSKDTDGKKTDGSKDTASSDAKRAGSAPAESKPSTSKSSAD